ncbi:MAG: DNA polymerase III [Treponema sp.]|nr:DNA polymerase III [Treponema sp.]
MFENIIAQAATDQLKEDILANRLAPSMLFFGPAASGKGSTALELARALSCENESGQAPWNCPCPSCVRHRSLVHPDLATIGPRGFAAEIAASRTAFLRDTASAAGRSLFVRSLRKLLGRFSPSVWEHESKSGRINPLSILQSLEEELDEFEKITAPDAVPAKAGSDAALEKLSTSLAKNAFKLEDECMGESVPIAQVRKATYWSRLSPTGNRKTLVIENADRMKEDARNALLKLLEEPPESICIVLTAQRREAVMPTILSRLRPYRFNLRSADEEREIIRRIFRDSRNTGDAGQDGKQRDVFQQGSPGLVAAYLDSFTPQPSEKLLPLAAFFIAAVTRATVVLGRSQGTTEISPALNTLGSYCARIAENAGLERTEEAGQTVATLVSQTIGFEGRSFPRFLFLNLQLVSEALTLCESGVDKIRYREMWKKRIEEAQTAHVIYNQRPELSLESLFSRLREDMAG